MPTKEPKTDMVGVMVSASVKDLIVKLATEMDRSNSYIGGHLLLRGLAAYQRDGQLKEPDSETDLTPKRVGTGHKVAPPQARGNNDQRDSPIIRKQGRGR